MVSEGTKSVSSPHTNRPAWDAGGCCWFALAVRE